MAKSQPPFWISPPTRSTVDGKLHHNWVVARSRAERKRQAVRVSIPDADLARFNAQARQTYISTQLQRAAQQLGVLDDLVKAARLARFRAENKPEVPQLVTATH